MNLPCVCANNMGLPHLSLLTIHAPTSITWMTWSAEFDIGFGTGISREGSVLDVAVELGIVKKAGAWFTYEGEQLGQGRENAKTLLCGSPELMVAISEQIREQSELRVGLRGPAVLDLSAGIPAEDPEAVESLETVTVAAVAETLEPADEPA